MTSLTTVTGAHDRDRTGDLVLTKDVLYRLSYVGRTRNPAIDSPNQKCPFFCPRTCHLVGSEFAATMLAANGRPCDGAGDGNRTHTISLEG